MSDIAIKIENVKKQYRLGTIGGGTLQGDIQSWWAKVRGKEDPNSKIGSKAYAKNEKFMALDGVDFEVKKGEAVGIIGHNGAGKSTLLKLLSRVTAPTEGNIYLNGRISSMLEVGTGFHAELTGRENVYLNGAILGMSRAEVTEKMDKIIEFSECGQFIDTPVKRYSSGMYVKLAFSVAAHLDSEILIMDEVLAVGDVKFQQKCINKMKNISDEEGRTILYVSHNMSTIRRLCDRCVVLDHGKVVFNGDVEQAISIYSNNIIKNDSYLDYSDYTRSPNESRALQFLDMTMPEKKTSDFVKGEKTKVVLKCKANKDFENIGIRLEIMSPDDFVAGTIFSDKLISAKAGDSIELVTKLDTSNLAPGNYRVAMLAYEFNEQGYQVGVDRVFPAMFINVEQNINDIHWLSNYWGHTQFNDLEIEEINILSKE